jgi:hypothetical protein
MTATLKRSELSVADDVTWDIHSYPAGVDIVFHKIAKESVPLATLILDFGDMATFLRDLTTKQPVNIGPTAIDHLKAIRDGLPVRAGGMGGDLPFELAMPPRTAQQLQFMLDDVIGLLETRR